MALVAQGGLPWLLWALAAASGTLGFGMRMGRAGVMLASIPFWFILAFFLWFFRDPDRTPSGGICSPADGRVVRIDEVEDPELGHCQRIAIFMSPLDVHVNRFPASGTVVAMRHVPGGHVPAFNKDAQRNERVQTTIETGHGPIKMVQIAGTVARRIVPYIEVGTPAQKGGRMGLIRLGSRCDVLIPDGKAQWDVGVGQKVQAATTRLGTWEDN